jgi:formaldehyde-activating enzyme
MPKISGVCVGASLVGEGNEVAHVDLLLGPRGSAVEQAYCNAPTNNKDGFKTLLADRTPWVHLPRRLGNIGQPVGTLSEIELTARVGATG